MPEAITLQDAFTRIVKHFDQMQEPAAESGDDGNCFYRTPEHLPSNRCFIGALIPDDVYSDAFEMRGITTLLSEHTRKLFSDDVQKHFLQLLELFRDIDVATLSSLQRIHDQWPMAGHNKATVREACLTLALHMA